MRMSKVSLVGYKWTVIKSSYPSSVIAFDDILPAKALQEKIARTGEDAVATIRMAGWCHSVIRRVISRNMCSEFSSQPHKAFCKARIIPDS